MPILFGRRIEVEIAGLTITDPRITVGIERHMNPTQDKGQVKIFNLTGDHADRIFKRGDAIIVRAGYPETVAVLYEGEVQRVRRGREALSHVTSIKLGDQVRSSRRLSGSFNKSYDGHVSCREIAVEIISEGLGLLAGPLTDIPEEATFNNFYWPGGPAVGALHALLRPIDRTWFEQDGVVRVNAPGKAQSDGRRIRVTPETGLIETPIATDEGAELRVFLDGRITLGSVIDVEAADFSGTWKVVGVQHTADNWSGSFETFVELRELA